MRKLLVVILLLSVMATGCGNRDGASVSSEASGQESVEDINSAEEQSVPEDAANIETSQSESEAPKVPLNTISVSLEEAKEIVQPDANGAFEISTIKQLTALAAIVNSGDTGYKDIKIVVTENISLSGYDFTPIGGFSAGEGYAFEGDFDGGDNIISGLTIRDNGYEDCTGLFGAIGESGTVRNLHLTGVNVSGKSSTGAVVGILDGKLENCSVRGAVSSKYQKTGGIAGEIRGSATVERCFVNVDVSGANSVGVLIGSLESGAVRDCYALGSVLAVEGKDGVKSGRIGGFIGNISSGEVERTYSNTEVYTNVSAALVGGFIGLNGGTVKDSYYNLTATMNWKAVGSADEDDETGVTGCETLELCEKDTYNGWDFINIWDIADDQNRGLPYLR